MAAKRRKQRRVRKKKKKSGKMTNVPLRRAMHNLGRMRSTKRRQALRHSNNVFMKQLSTAVKSVRRKKLPNNVRTKLLKHRSTLRSLANPKASISSKRKLAAQQKSHFFNAILAALAH